MSEQTPAALDPTLTQSNLALALQHETLAHRPDVEQIDLRSSGPVSFDLAHTQPLEVEEGYGLIASLRVGPEKFMHVWGLVDGQGTFDRRGVLLADGTSDLIEATKHPQRNAVAPFQSVFAGSPATVVGRSTFPSDGPLGKFPGSVSRNHFAIGVDGQGVLTVRDLQSTNGTEIIKKTPQKSTPAEAAGKYDYLFADDPETPADPVIDYRPETVKNPRLETVLAPLPTIDMMPAPAPVNYDYLFNANEEERQAGIRAAADQAAQREAEARNYMIVTDESRQQAADRLTRVRGINHVVDKLVRDYETQTGTHNPTAAVDAIRTNPDLRYALGSYLYNVKLRDKLHTMGERLVYDGEKSPNHRGYYQLGKLRSREYAVLLALAMLDGTFVEPGRGDEIERNASGQPVLGQHRAAAHELLS